MSEQVNQIICGDAAEVLRTFSRGSVALTVTSPPYYLHRDYEAEGQIGQETTLAGYLGRMEVVLRELLRITDDRGSCFMVVGDTYIDRRLQLVPHRLAILAADVGWTVRNDLIWAKSDPPPDSPRNRWRAGHEHILFLTKKPSGYRFDADAIRVPYAPATLRRWGAGQAYGGPKSKARRRAGDSRMRHGQTFQLNPGGCLPADVWRVPCSNTSAKHYAAFPSRLVQPIVKACSAAGDVVLDPFAGTGTVCALAAKFQRLYVGIELNPDYAELARLNVEYPEQVTDENLTPALARASG